MTKGWKGESKRHALSRMGIKTGRKASAFSMSSSVFSSSDISSMSSSVLEQLAIDETSKLSADAFEELVVREKEEHPWLSSKQAEHVVNDHLVKLVKERKKMPASQATLVPVKPGSWRCTYCGETMSQDAFDTHICDT
jgi:aspartate carbamoyltransferase regulatory subunit